MTSDSNAKDPLEFVRNMWSSMGFSLPGMVTPTLDVDELDKRITDMKAVEQWLKMNLNMLQMSTQGLELQRATLAAVKAMSQSEQQADTEQTGNPFAQAMMWPWSLMGAPAATTENATEESSTASKTRSTRTRKAASDKSE